MAMAVTGSTPEADSEGVEAPDLRIFVFALFFIFGGITSLNDVIIPKLKELFTLSYFQALLVQSAFFGAYFVFSIPAAAIVRKSGYMRTAAIGLLMMTAGCLLFVPASLSGIPRIYGVSQPKKRNHLVAHATLFKITQPDALALLLV